jgi:hypothetical protein
VALASSIPTLQFSCTVCISQLNWWLFFAGIADQVV